MEKSLKNDRVLYFHKKPNGEIFYIGIGNKYRPYSKKGRNKWWHNIVSKYGYIVDIVHENLSSHEAIKLECFYIKNLGRADLKKGLLINMTDGGDGVLNMKHSEESKSKISKNNARFWFGKKASKETKLKLRKSHIGIQAGEKHYMYGKHHSQETKDKISIAHIGMKHSEKTLKQMSDVKIGKIKTKEHRENLSKSLLGKKKSDEAKNNMSIAKKGKILTESQKIANKKNGENKIGTKLSLSTREKISEAAKKRNIELGLKVSNYKGVTWNKERNKWKVNVYQNGKSNFLGYFENELDAHKKYENFIKSI